MKIIHGDLIELAKQGLFDVIVHGCNCYNNMGKGIALQIKHAFPEAYGADCKTIKGDARKLGTFSYAEVMVANKPLIIINAYTQYDWLGYGVKVDYDAVEKVFSSIKEACTGYRIAYPMIGAGLAGGDWNKISAIIDKELAGEDHTLVIYKKVKL